MCASRGHLSGGIFLVDDDDIADARSPQQRENPGSHAAPPAACRS
jgi:hypothetical protein